jgi:hypothetical protein
VREYCQFESFNASCPNGHVVVIAEAYYGRLRIGRCVNSDYGSLGCSADVMDIMATQCTGRRECTVSVPMLRAVVQPCPEDLTSYLEVAFDCVRGK